MYVPQCRALAPHVQTWAHCSPSEVWAGVLHSICTVFVSEHILSEDLRAFFKISHVLQHKTRLLTITKIEIILEAETAP